MPLAGRFEPESKQDIYLMEFQSHCKKQTEFWVEFGEDLRILVDKAYPMLEDDVRHQLALQHSCIMIKLPLELNIRNLKTIEAAVEATLELESYLLQHSSPGTIASVQVDSVDQLMEMMAQLLPRVEQSEMRGQLEQNSGGPPKRHLK